MEAKFVFIHDNAGAWGIVFGVFFDFPNLEIAEYAFRKGTLNVESFSGGTEIPVWDICEFFA